MTNQQHPITPPPELVEQWANVSAQTNKENGTYAQHEFALATQAARWGADQELKACCELVANTTVIPLDSGQWLHSRRRPKPPSLKEQALDAWDRLRNEAWCEEIDYDLDFVRRALEALDD